MIKNLDKINTIKRAKIEKGLNYLENLNKDKLIEKVIIFGSSITNDCSKESDIDICLFTQYDCSNRTFFYIYGGLPLVMDDLCDIVIWNKIDDKLKSEIKKKGVEVYEF